MQTVAILCASSRSAYRDLEGVEVYDQTRDARTFSGGMPVVAHPPCRAWSIRTKHQAKPEPWEKELGLWCAEQVKECGGILEQPAFSELWQAAGLPEPGAIRDRDSYSLAVWQAWWGYPLKKATWLYLSRIEMKHVDIPFRLHPRGGDRRAEQVMSKRQRSETVPALAVWLVDLARHATPIRKG